MTPELPPNPRAELEARITAWLLGELSADEAAAVRKQIEADPQLQKLRDRLSQTLNLLRETVATPMGETPSAPTPLKLSAARREKLLASFKTIRIEKLEPKPGYKFDWKFWVASAAVIFLLAAISLPHLVGRSKAVNEFALTSSVSSWHSQGNESPKIPIPATRPTGPRDTEISKNGEDIVRELRERRQLEDKEILARDVSKDRIALPELNGEKLAYQNGNRNSFSGGAGLATSELNKPVPPVATTPASPAPVDGGLDATVSGESPVPPAVAAASAPVALPAPTALSDTFAVNNGAPAAVEDLDNLKEPAKETETINGTWRLHGSEVAPASSAPQGAGGGRMESAKASAPTHGAQKMAEKPFEADGGAFAFSFHRKAGALTSLPGQAPLPAEVPPVPTASPTPTDAAGQVVSADLPQTVAASIAVTQREPPPFVGTPTDNPETGSLYKSTNAVVTYNLGFNPQSSADTSINGPGSAPIRQAYFDNSASQNSPAVDLKLNQDNTASRSAWNAQIHSAGNIAGAGENLNSGKVEQVSQDGLRREWLYKEKASAVAQTENNNTGGLAQSLSGASNDVGDAATRPLVPPLVPQPEVLTSVNAFTTFSLNVSDVAFKLAQASLQNGQMPEAGSMRSEEFINAFDYRDPEPVAGAPIGFAWERAGDPFTHNRDFLRFSIKTAAQGREANRPLNLVLIVDKSGSMERADRVAIIAEALKVLSSELHPNDTLSVVVFARTARLFVDGVPGSQAGEVAKNLRALTPEGGTNLEEAMRLAYEAALRHYLAGGENRVVLLTDGAANLGNVEPAALKRSVETNRKQGIAFDCFGVGWDGYNDPLLETLSRAGNGRYGFINTPEEAATEFAGKLAGALRVAAADVKVQVEFNPGRIAAYRQIGYAKDQLKKEDFRNNDVKAAQLGAAESGNALYTIQIKSGGEGPIGTVRVRYRVPGTDNYEEHEWLVPYTGSADSLDKASAAMRLAAVAAEFSEWLAGSQYAAGVTPDQLLNVLRGVPQVYGADARPSQLEWMIRQAKSISGK